MWLPMSSEVKSFKGQDIPWALLTSPGGQRSGWMLGTWCDNEAPTMISLAVEVEPLVSFHSKAQRRRLIAMFVNRFKGYPVDPTGCSLSSRWGSPVLEQGLPAWRMAIPVRTWRLWHAKQPWAQCGIWGRKRWRPGQEKGNWDGIWKAFAWLHRLQQCNTFSGKAGGKDLYYLVRL